jgi:MFS family permease
MPGVVRFLLVNHLLGNMGFYLLIPYLATYVTNDLGFGFAVAGLILGIRNLAQQGLFLIGGTASDWIGPRVVIISGTIVRACGFALFIVADSFLVLLVAALLTGLAGALFSPAVRAYISIETGPERRVEAFALLTVFGQGGALIGPVLGAALLRIDFRFSAAVAATVFAALAIAQWRMLTPRAAEPTESSVLRDWANIVRNGHFVAFTLALSGVYSLQNQLYLAVPNDVVRLTGNTDGVALVFALSTALSILAQMPLSRRLARRAARGPAIAGGLLLMGLAFLPPALLGEIAMGSALALLPVLATGAVLALGVMAAQPFIYELISAFGPERTTGTRFGFFYVVTGIVAAGSSTLIGAATDYWDGAAADPLCVSLGVAGALGVWILHRAGWLPLGHTHD